MKRRAILAAFALTTLSVMASAGEKELAHVVLEIEGMR